MSVGFVNNLGRPAIASVTAGGTGLNTGTTAYAPVCIGTTATGNFQVASTGLSTSGFVLTSNGASALPSFQAIPAGSPGSIVQIITASFTTQTVINGSTYVTTGLSASITPTSASNHIMVIGSLSIYTQTSASALMGLQIHRAGASIVDFGNGAETQLSVASSVGFIRRATFNYYDAPATTSATTYAFFANATAGTVRINDSGQLSNIILMEIAL